MKNSKLFFKLLLLEMKRFMKSIKAILLGAVVLILLISTIAFCGIRVLSETGSVVRSRIGVVSYETDSHLDYMYTFLDSFASTSTYFEFEDYADGKEAMNALADGTLTAVMVIPEGTVNSIMDGTNQHIELFFSNATDVGTILLNELAKAGASILTAAQSDIYAITDLYLEHQLDGYLEDAWMDLNLVNMRLALSRDLLFQTHSVSATQWMTLPQYYTASAIVLILFLLGMALASYYERPQSGMQLALRRYRITPVHLHNRRTLCVFFFYALLLLAAALPFVHTLVDDPQAVLTPLRIVQGILMLLLLAAMYAGLLQLFYAVTKNTTAAMMLLFFSVLLEHVMAGGIIPYGLLPDLLQKIAVMLPSYQAIHCLGAFVTTGFRMTSIPGLTGYCMYFAIITLGTLLLGDGLILLQQRRARG